MLKHHITMIIDGLPGGGAEKVVLTLAQGFLQQGHQVSLLSLRDVCNYPLPDCLDYRVVADNAHGAFRKLTELTRRAHQLDRAFSTLQAERGPVDLVLSNLHKTDRIVSRSRVIPHQKVWFCLHGVMSASYLGHRTGLSRWLKRRKIQGVYQGKNITGVSHFVTDDLCQQFAVRPAQQKVIYNPFDFGAIRAAALDTVPLPTKSYLLHVGRFHTVKRHDRLLRAYALSGLTAPLVLLGEGSESARHSLQTLAKELNIAERVIFQGFDPNPYRWIRHARQLILSSDSEGFGNVLVEALICGTQIVSTRCPGGPAEIMTGAYAAGLADLTPESLARAMITIDQHPVTIDPASLQSYRLDVICGQYLSLISA